MLDFHNINLQVARTLNLVAHQNLEPTHASSARRNLIGYA